jgi:hypothetical protein
VSFTVYEDPEALEKVGAALARQPDIDPLGIEPDEVDYYYYSEVIEF